ncbi:hypothetical protein MADA3029_710019 [Vibrio nigripulchritudo MADA3029]|nr:hypothetical protein VIBNIMADA3020_220019 [Vibrio nigripulchritudo MADA3020]CCN52851.1 hypothetical protein VIBNIMADA3021_160018 [Vibrio nigripulchritudo MADA3021]CCN61083.1 hypothetical protein MADA3029_710019 [Vibrio nigripulchritudo MADA3029]
MMEAIGARAKSATFIELRVSKGTKVTPHTAAQQVCPSWDAEEQASDALFLPLSTISEWMGLSGECDL